MPKSRLLLLLLAGVLPALGAPEGNSAPTPAPTPGLGQVAAAPTAPRQPKLVLGLLIDQFRYDYLERFRDLFGEGGFRRLLEEGAFLTFARYNYVPTVTAPGHASVFSGAPPSLHGIIANEWFSRATGKPMYCVADPSVATVGAKGKAGQMSPRNFVGANFADMMRLHYQSKVVGLSFKDRGAVLPAGRMPTGAYWFDGDSGHFITSSYYRRELPAWLQAFNARERARDFMGQTWERLLPVEKYQYPDAMAGESHLAGELGATFPHTVHPDEEEPYDALAPTPFANQLLAELARAAVEGEHLGEGSQPDLLTVSFSAIDANGHRFGPYSQEVQDLVLRLDRELASFFRFLDEKIGRENLLIFLTADHGVAPTPEFAEAQGFDGSRLDPLEWMGELAARLNEQFGPGRYFQISRPVEGMIYFDREVLRARRVPLEAICNFVKEWALHSGRFQACYTREQILEGRAPGPMGERVVNGFHAERSGDVLLVLRPFQLSWPQASGTTHGSPYSYDTHVPVLFQGPLFRPGRYADEFFITDIVPTLCAALHVDEPPMSIGRPFVKVLAEQPSATP